MRVGIVGPEGLSDLSEMLVRGELWRLVTSHTTHDLVGISCLHEGPETWFARSVLDHGGKLEVLLSASASRAGAFAASGRAAVRTLLNQANAVHRLAPADSGGLGDDTCTAMVAMIDELIAVWDGVSPGPAADLVAAARTAGLYVELVWPPGCEGPSAEAAARG
ncbi:hypothetical protein ACIRBX_19905 [Kitasatospora sp. NPDC096147]|uniref:hypothetical protein n=1 Tax=Kitasatospora sp. NPDC096147 TaxID=3364093 RepID=UPI0038013D33